MWERETDQVAFSDVLLIGKRQKKFSSERGYRLLRQFAE
jgi:hypothetical protein